LQGVGQLLATTLLTPCKEFGYSLQGVYQILATTHTDSYKTFKRSEEVKDKNQTFFLLKVGWRI